MRKASGKPTKVETNYKVGVFLTPSEHTVAQRLAKKSEKSLSTYIGDLVRVEIANMPVKSDAATAAKRWKKLKADLRKAGVKAKTAKRKIKAVKRTAKKAA